MTLEELAEKLAATGYPVRYSHFTEKVKPPYVCYLVAYSHNLFADGEVYQSINRLQVELYTDKKDLAAEAAVEHALAEICWEKNEEYINDEKMYQTTYEFEVLNNG